MAVVLVVDDIEADRRLAAALLRHHGHDVLEASDGKRGLALAREARPELVLSDIVMPSMDGFELARRIRSDRLLKTTAVVLWTANTIGRRVEELARACGVSRIIPKPAEAAQLLDMLEVALSSPRPDVPPSSEGEGFERQHLQLLTNALYERIEDLKAARRALDRSDEHLRFLAETAGDFIYRIRLVPDFAYEYVAPSAFAMTSYTAEEIQADPTVAFTAIHPDDLERFRAWLDSPPPEQRRGVFRWRRKDGTSYWAETVESPIIDGGAVVGIQGIARDVTDRVLAEEALRGATERLRKAQEIGRIGDWTWDVEANTASWSDELYRIYGVDPGREPTYERFLSLVHPDDRPTITELVRASVEEARPYQCELRIVRPDGLTVVVDARGEIVTDRGGRVVRLVGTALDITGRKGAEDERRRADERIRHIERMETAGQLAGGIAHDFNNILGVVMSSAALIQAEAPSGPIAEEAAEIRAATERAAGLVRQLLTFARRDDAELEPLDVGAVVRDLEGLLRRMVGEQIVLDLRVSDRVPPVLATAGQIEQIVLNLALNARDAMPDSIGIDVSSVAFAQDDRAVAIAVRDDGAGMTSDVVARCLDPFFTTKAPGRGTGLGLSTVYGIAKRLGGDLDVQSAPGRGTVVTVRLPVASGGPAAEPVGAPDRERILLVEDDEALRRATRRLLERAGYRVADAATPSETFRRVVSGGGFDLIVSDIVLPEMSGRELRDRLRGLRPSMRFLFVSGYSGDVIAREGPLDAPLLEKPFTEEDLLRAVREAIGTKRGAA